MACPTVAALLSSQGFDWIWIDTEHGSISVETVQMMIQASQGTDAVPLVRLAENFSWMAKAHLDAGAMGIITPMINSATDACDSVAALRYPPQGIRGFGPAMAPTRWRTKDAKSYAAVADQEILAIAQIEHITAVDAIDEIVAVPGLDLVFVGMYDLSASLGLLGQVDHPSVVAAAHRVLESAQRAGVAAGVIALEPEAIRQRREEGFQFIAVTTDTVLLSEGACGLLNELQR
ncbi:HpcH/HpaI aldolase family protein [Cyanobium sp. ATX 6F1]|uniref:HpcH/HpaI aldolase family protein n=1 Tax=unclassified Cyanobium TaxID=2627006 RepID=UPI0020CC3862|nr:aldolase/citrate lyase family protein [Cyanobium sp. ATX 6F1]